MGWFEEQLRQRARQDRESFGASMQGMASAVLGGKGAGGSTDLRQVTREAIEAILRWYGFPPVDVPRGVPLEDELEYSLQVHGLLQRNVELTQGWQNHSFGPLMAFRVEDGLPVVLLPAFFRGYYFRDSMGNVVRVTKKNAGLFETQAFCFYRPLPQKSLRVWDLLTYMAGCLDRSDLVALLVLSLLVTLCGLVLPRVTRVLVGPVLDQGDQTLLWATAVYLLCVLVSRQLLTASRELCLARVKTKVGLPVEAAVMGRLLTLPAPFFRKFNAGTLSSRVETVNQLSNLLGEALSSLIAALFSLLYLDMMSRISSGLARVAGLILLVQTAIMALTCWYRSRVNRHIMEQDAQESGVSFSVISGVQKIRVAGAERRAFARWANAYTKWVTAKYDPPLPVKLESVLSLAVTLFGTLAIYLTALTDGVSPQEFITFNTAFGAVCGAFAVLSEAVQSAAQAAPILGMVEPILQAEPEANEERQLVTRLSGSIDLVGLCFRYNESMPYLVDNMTLHIKSGEYVAVVGRTGCGKSTLLRLLLGFETPQRGAVYYDDKDLRQLDLASLRRQLGVVTQDGRLFQGDIFSNITVSAPQATLEDAWAAAELAGIADDIRAMPMGMHTFLSEGQGGISGGQKQRLMIARAIVSKPRILFLDEATSALDNLTQKRVSQALDRLRCTRIVIAHRLSTIQNCDRILVLDQGKIVEDGTYQELIDRGGFFAELVERQRLQ